MWTVLREAHGGNTEAARAAQQLLVERYGPPIRRYLLKLTADEDAADELFQDFVVRLIEGDFRHAAPDRGRFRAYLKTILVRTVARRRQKQLPLTREVIEIEAPNEPEKSMDDAFDEGWREHLLLRTWSALRDARAVYVDALKLRVEHPHESSDELATRFSTIQGRVYSSESYRQLLHRSRRRFAQLLVMEVAHSLKTADREHVEDELSVLDLLPYCRHALAEWS